MLKENKVSEYHKISKEKQIQVKKTDEAIQARHESILEDEAQAHVKAGVEMPYNLRFMQPVLDWVWRMTELAGSSQTENNRIRLALEESLSFLVNSYPGAEDSELIQIGFCLMTNDLIVITIKNAGPPIHIDKVSIYDPQHPSTSNIDGLWYFLARASVDDLTFKNFGMDGWKVIIKQQLTHPSYKNEKYTENNSATNKKLVFTSHLATPEDAGALMDLVYDTYGYAYPIEDFYHQSKLSRVLEKENMDYIIVKANGIIVASVSMIIDPKTPHCCCTGTLMINRAFRGTRAIVTILRESAQYFQNNKFGVDLYYSTSITENTAAQKAVMRTAFYPMALLLVTIGKLGFKGKNLDNAVRETFLILVRLNNPPKLKTIYLAEIHHEVMRPLLDNLGCPAELKWNKDKNPSGENSFTISENLLQGSASITFEEVGIDWASMLRKSIFQLNTKQVESITILIPAWFQPPSDIDHQLAQLNGIFTGIKPVSASQYYLVYCVLSCTVDFEKIKIVSPEANNLKDHIQKLYLETFA